MPAPAFDSSLHVGLRSLYQELNNKYPDDRNYGYDWMFWYLNQHNIGIIHVLAPVPQWSGQEIRAVSLADAERLRSAFDSEYVSWKQQKQEREERQRKINEDYERRKAARLANQPREKLESDRRRELRELEGQHHHNLRQVNQREHDERSKANSSFWDRVAVARTKIENEIADEVTRIEVTAKEEREEINAKNSLSISVIESKYEDLRKLL